MNLKSTAIFLPSKTWWKLREIAIESPAKTWLWTSRVNCKISAVKDLVEITWNSHQISGENVAWTPSIHPAGNYVKSPPKFIFCTKIILTSYKYDAVRVYFEPSIQSLKVRENLDHLKVNKEKEIQGREILFYIIFNMSIFSS